MRIPWNELSPDQQRQRRASFKRLEAFFSPLDPTGASSFGRGATDAGIALSELAEPDDSRIRDTANRITKVLAKVERKGKWRDYYEWRISTYGTERLERLHRGFRATSEMNGRFRGDFATFGEAWEAVHVLSGLGRSLFYALGWTTNDTNRSLELEADRPVAEAYLKGLARNAATHVTSKRGGIVIGPPPADWNDPPDHVFIVSVRRDSLVLECECTTQERAELFLAVFDMLAEDLLEILDWKPLPETD